MFARLLLAAVFCAPILAAAANPNLAPGVTHPRNPVQHDPDFRDDPACVPAACSLGGLRCDSFSSDLDRAGELCQGVQASCLEKACALGAYSCSFSSGLERVASLCQGTRPGCVETVCAQGALHCASSSDLDRAGELCKTGVRATCIQEMCSQGQYRCATFADDLEQVTELCNQR
jgi:hypothetical protein